MPVCRVQCDQNCAEVEPPHGLHQNGGIVIAGDAQKPDSPIVTGFKQCCERDILAEDLPQVGLCPQIVQLPQ
jgi:hypothetical protein